MYFVGKYFLPYITYPATIDKTHLRGSPHASYEYFSPGKAMLPFKSVHEDGWVT